MPNTVEATLAQSNGPAFVERNGNKIELKEGDGIYESDTIITGSETTIDLVFRDGTKSRIGPDSEMRLVDFEFGDNEEASFVVNLTQGAMRTVTGGIVKMNPEAFEVVTPRATAGIRGTEFITEVRNDVENHVVLYISGGSVMLLENKDGTSLSFDKPLQGTSIAADGSMRAQEFSLQDMTAMLSAISPAMGANIPTSAEDQGNWSDINTDMHAQSSDVMANVNVSIVYDDSSALESVLVALQKTAGIVINSVVATPAQANELITEDTIAEESSFVSAYMQEEITEGTSLFNASSSFTPSNNLANNHENLGSHDSNHNDNSHSGSGSGGSGSDGSGSGGGSVEDNIINIGGIISTNKDLDNDLNNILNVGSIISSNINTGSGNDVINVTGNNLQSSSLNLGSGNDIVKIDDDTTVSSNNSINGGSGFDFIITNKYISSSNLSNIEAKISGIGIDNISSIADLNAMGVTIVSDTQLSFDSSWTHDSASNAYINTAQNVTITYL